MVQQALAEEGRVAEAYGLAPPRGDEEAVAGPTAASAGLAEWPTMESRLEILEPRPVPVKASLPPQQVTSTHHVSQVRCSDPHFVANCATKEIVPAGEGRNLQRGFSFERPGKGSASSTEPRLRGNGNPHCLCRLFTDPHTATGYCQCPTDPKHTLPLQGSPFQALSWATGIWAVSISLHILALKSGPAPVTQLVLAAAADTGMAAMASQSAGLASGAVLRRGAAAAESLSWAASQAPPRSAPSAPSPRHAGSSRRRLCPSRAATAVKEPEGFQVVSSSQYLFSPSHCDPLRVLRCFHS